MIAVMVEGWLKEAKPEVAAPGFAVILRRRFVELNGIEPSAS